MANPDCPSEAAPPGAGPQPACPASTRTRVPLSVWPAIPPPGPCPASLTVVPCPQRWPATAAATVITAFTSPGDLVVAPGPGALLAGSCPDAGQAALAVITACATPGCAPAAARPGAPAAVPDLIFAACHRILAPGRLLAIITNAACYPGHAGDVTAAARAAGLVYTQHIIAVHAAISAGRLHPPAAAPDRLAGGELTGPHVHSDILLLRRPGGPRHD